MPVFLRKSLRAGPLRFNLSKSGIGVSAGVPGLRVGLLGPRGHYVYAGRGGVYYRKTLNRAATTNGGPGQPVPVEPQLMDPSEPLLEDVTGATVVALASAAPSDVTDQLNASAAMTPTWPIAAVGGGVLSLVLLVALWPVGIAAAIVTAAGSWWLHQRDAARRAVVLFYDVKDEYAERFEALVEAFKAVQESQQRFRILSSGAMQTDYQRKIHAGAGAVVERVAVSAGTDGPKQLTTNIEVPALADSKRAIYFMPDRVLLREGSTFASLPYAELKLEAGRSRWIEDGMVPGDAQVVDSTWKYLNKSGGPDRRFKDNRELPIILLSTLELTSEAGLASLYQFSSPGAAETLGAALQGMAAIATSPGAPADAHE